MTTTSRIRLLAGTFLAVAILIPACKKRQTEPEAQNDPVPAVVPVVPGGAPNDAKGKNTVAIPKANKTASLWAGTAIPVDHRNTATFGPAGCPVIVVGTIVHDSTTYKAVRQLPDPYEPQALRALSPDGKSFAAASKSPNQEMTGVTVWSTENAARLLDVGGKKDAYLDVIAFHGNSHLLLGGRHDRIIDVWDIPTKKKIGQITVPDTTISADKLAFSPDGKLFAGTTHDKVVVCEFSTNKPIATMAPPSEQIGKVGKPGDTDAIFVNAWTKGIAFSPDGKELAIYTTHPSPRLIVWSVKGQMVMDLSVPMPNFVSHKNSLEWMPDGAGLLVNGYLVDRASGRVVVSMRVPFGTDTLPHLLDQNRIIGLFGEDNERLQTISLPWDKLNASLKKLNEKGDAYVSPGESVSVQIDLTGLRGDEAETRKVLGEALTRRLARDGIAIAAGRPTVLWLKLSEKAGDTLAIYERNSPFDRRGADTGRKATEAKGAVVLEVWSQGEKQPLWRGQITAGSGRSFTEEINDASLRKSMLSDLTNQLSQMDLPYFIPKAKDVVTLPAVVE